MILRGRPCDEREFSDDTGQGTEYLLDGIVVAKVWETRILTPEQQAQQEQEVLQRERDESRMARLLEIRQKIKDGTETAQDRSKAIRLLIGVVRGLQAEQDEAT